MMDFWYVSSSEPIGEGSGLERPGSIRSKSCSAMPSSDTGFTG